MRNEPVEGTHELAELRLRPSVDHAREAREPRETRDRNESRTIIIRHGSTWQPLAFVCVGLLLIVAILLGHQALQGIERQNELAAANLTGFERRVEQLESGLSWDAKRRYMLLGMRDHILKVNPHVSLDDSYRYARFALEASERYPAVDPLLLLAIGTVESGYDARARSHADARGLYQIWPSTGRLLLRNLGWDYDEAALYDPEKNTQAAALYLDILFATYSDPQLVLAEYNGGPLNAGYFRAKVGALADETRTYVPRVLQLQEQLKQQFAKGLDLQMQLMHRDAQREGKTLVGTRR
jgi:hypothetical protein